LILLDFFFRTLVYCFSGRFSAVLEALTMRIVHKRRKRNPALSKAAIGKIERREARIDRMLERMPDTYHRELRVQGVRDEIQAIIQLEEKIHQAGIDRDRARVFAKWEHRREHFVDRRLKPYRDALKRAQQEAANELHNPSGHVGDIEEGSRGDDGQDGLRADGGGDGRMGSEPTGGLVLRQDDRRTPLQDAPPAARERETVDDFRASIRAAALADGVPLSDLAPEPAAG
jgi:hypothetical protein